MHENIKQPVYKTTSIPPILQLNEQKYSIETAQNMKPSKNLKTED